MRNTNCFNADHKMFGSIRAVNTPTCSQNGRASRQWKKACLAVSSKQKLRVTEIIRCWRPGSERQHALKKACCTLRRHSTPRWRGVIVRLVKGALTLLAHKVSYVNARTLNRDLSADHWFAFPSPNNRTKSRFKSAFRQPSENGITGNW